jgi:adenine-specific DNA-methyltransferase
MTPYYNDGRHTIYNARCEDVLPSLADNSVDLIATDPPYFGVKDEAWDNAWKNADAFLEWMGGIMVQWKRILKPNGSLYVFASPQMGARVEVLTSKYLEVLNNITWQKPPYSTKAEMFDKETMRAFFPASERIIFAEQYGSDTTADDEAGYTSQCEVAKRGVFGEYLKAEFARAGVNGREVCEAIGAYGKVNHGGAVSNWLLGFNCPTPEQYAAMRSFLNSRGGDYLKREYEDLKREYEDLRRPFFATPQTPFTDVWTFPTVSIRDGKHLCQKPESMLEHIIRTSSRPDAVVLDCFAGSGTTLRAAKNLGRRSIGVEMCPQWCRRSAERLSQETLFAEVAA